MRLLSLLLSIAVLSLGVGCGQASKTSATDPKYVFENPSPHKSVVLPEEVEFSSAPKNIILLIGDGMGVTQIYSAMTANQDNLNLKQMKHIGFSQTQSADNYITDSAAGGTAIATGQRVNNGTVAMDENGNPIKSILYLSEENNKATGLVSTSAITHATPASFIAHQPSREMYEAIAADFVGSGIDIFIGGGRNNFAKRKDGRNLLEELQNLSYKVFNSLEEAASEDSAPMAILTADEHNPSYPERGDMLPDATNKAIEVLKNNENGFFLMVEGSRIDWGGHANNISEVVLETLDFDRAIGVALAFAAENKETLVIVTADHETGGLTIDKGDISKGKVSAKFASTDHTAVMVPVFAYGPGAELFMGILKNTDIFNNMVKAFSFEPVASE